MDRRYHPQFWPGNALELRGGVTVGNTLTLQGTNNVFFGGVDFGGQLASVSGVNSYAGTINMAYDAAIGAAQASTLRLTGDRIVASATRQLSFNAVGEIDLQAFLVAPTNGFYAINKYGAGTLTITTPQSPRIAFDLNSRKAFNIREGSVVLSGGSFVSATAGSLPTATTGTTTVTLNGTNTIVSLGLKPGMFVLSTAIPTRTQILSVDANANTFTLTAPTTAVLGHLSFLTGGTMSAPVILDPKGSLILDSSGVSVSGSNNITANGRLGNSASTDNNLVLRDQFVI